jgi:hypothetical protein
VNTFLSSHTADAAIVQRGHPPTQTPAAVRQCHRPGGTAEPPPKKPTLHYDIDKKLTNEVGFFV